MMSTLECWYQEKLKKGLYFNLELEKKSVFFDTGVLMIRQYFFTKHMDNAVNRVLKLQFFESRHDCFRCTIILRNIGFVATLQCCTKFSKY